MTFHQIDPHATETALRQAIARARRRLYLVQLTSLGEALWLENQILALEQLADSEQRSQQ